MSAEPPTLSFTAPAGQRFQLRAAAVIEEAGWVLLHRALPDTQWALPGGRVQWMETAAAAVQRECWEELQVPVRCGPLRLLVENTFTLQGQACHEVGLYFDVSLPDDCALRDRHRVHAGAEAGRSLEFRWFALEQLGRVDLRPSCLVQVLQQRETTFAHIVQP